MLILPMLILAAMQVNIRAGAMPPKEASCVACLKIAVDVL